VPLLLVDCQARPGVSMHGAKKQLTRLELELFQYDLAKVVGGPTVEAYQIGRDQHEPFAVILEHDDPGEQRIVHALGQLRP